MNKNILPGLVACILLALPVLLFAQESNKGEDYTAYMQEVRQWNKLLGSGPKPASLLTKEGLEASRNGMKAFITKSTGIQPVIVNIAGPGGDIPLRIFKPDTIKAVMLDIHGGGWIQGIAASDDAFNNLMATTCKVAIVSVDYRLAPEAPFPACIDDCKAAARWLVQHAKADFGTDKLMLTGQSAGAHLAALMAIYLRDSLNAGSLMRGISLQYGCFDLGGTPSERQASDTTLILSKTGLGENFQLVFGGWSTDKLEQPQYSPLFADLRGLPPAYFMVGTADPLLDDTRFMESRWRSAGNKTYLAVYPECPHGLNIFPTKLAKLANEKMFAWMRQQIE
ncbi:MAG TPA: alpha/beta hydrolase [Chitinophagaceae bacterium]|nr:alpha/beta hydrolase [Chitinophagaceae bacterium]